MALHGTIVRTTRRAAVAGLVMGMVLVLLAPMPAQAIVGAAGPGSAENGYVTPLIYVNTFTQTAVFVNADPDAQHNITAWRAYGPDDQPWCEEGEPCPVFWTETISVGATPIQGLENTFGAVPYLFYCTIHPDTMQGELLVL